MYSVNSANAIKVNDVKKKEHYEIHYVSFRKIVYRYKTSTIIQTTTYYDLENSDVVTKLYKNN